MHPLARSLACLAASIPLAASAQGKPVQGQGGKTELTWYGHAAFVLRTPGGTVLAIDPFLGNPTSPDKDAAQKLG